MASLALHLKSHHHKSPQTLLKFAPNLTFSHFYSSSSDGDNNGGNASKPQSFSSYFSDIRSKLKQHEQQNQSAGSQPSRFSPPSSSTPTKVASIDEIRKNLSDYRRRSSVPAPETPSAADSEQPTLLQDLYKRNMAMSNPNPLRQNLQSGKLSFESIQESLRQLKATQADKNSSGGNHLSLSKYKERFKMTPSMAKTGGTVYGGSTDRLPISVFGKELNERDRKKRGEGQESFEDELAKSELIKMYSHAELGEKLRELRPESTKKEKGGKEGWFSLQELNERLKKLREMEENQQVAGKGGVSFGELRASLKKIRLSDDAKAMRPEYPIDILGKLSGRPSLNPPKEHLVEKYFHPDNMSSVEKLKIELKKIRDDFKMHESDCGSARVQIAQLTTEILHLSSILHKKDKHSRRGLLGKVQQRKKLLKYLRRTDWESYCFVLSKLGLRDNPDYKH